MNIVVLGSNGLLGGTLVPHLFGCGYNVTCVDRSGGAVVTADLVDENQVNNILNEHRPDVVVNLAAFTNVDECEKNPSASYLLNVRIVENVTDWIRKYAKECHLIQISTDQVYDGPGPHRESHVNLTNYYNFSKYAGELVAASVSSTILRTNFFGPSQCPGRSSLSDWLVKSLKNGDSITVFDDVWFSPLSLRRLARFIELAIDKRCRGTYNLGSRNGKSKAYFAFALAETLGLSTVNMKRGCCGNTLLVAYRPKDMRMDSTLFEEVFGVELPTLDEEIKLMKGCY